MNTSETLGRLAEWLHGFPQHDGIRYLSSARSFGHSDAGEEEYAKQFSVDGDYLRCVGSGIAYVLSAAEADSKHGALEIGCGTGIFSHALVAATTYPRYYISDMSPAFVKRTRALLAKSRPAGAVDYLVLSSEAFDSWPQGTLSLVALRYVLHHVLDWRAFIAHASALLVPGGVLVFEEPCADGYLLQAILMQSLRKRLQDFDCSDAVRKEIDFFISTIFWYLRTDVDKTNSEDKHLFQPTNVVGLAQDVGLRSRFYPNVGFEAVAEGQPPRATYFVDEFRHNLKVNFGFSAETLAVFETHVAPVCDELQTISGAANGPIIKGLFVFSKPA